MLAFFRIIDLSRIITIAILLVIIRLPFWILGLPAIESTFQFRILGDALANGKMLYYEIWHYCPPLSALFFQGIAELFGKSFIAYQAIAVVLVFLQALYFNSILTGLDAFRDRTLVPMLFYIFFGSLFIEFFGLSPELLSLFPILYLIDLIIQQTRYGASDNNFYLIGFTLSLALLINSVSFWLIPFCLIYFPFVFVMNPRRFGSMLAGLLFPILSTAIYFYMRGNLDGFLNLYLFRIFDIFDLSHITLRQYIIVFTIPGIFLFIGIITTVFRGRFLNYQVGFINFFLLLLIVVIPQIIFSKELSIKSYFLLIPICVFFSTHLYLQFNRTGINELIFTFLLFLIVFVNFGFTYKSFFNPKTINIDDIVLRVSNQDSEKGILNLSGNYGYWYDNNFCGPFMYEPYTNDFFEDSLHNEKVIQLHKIIQGQSIDKIYDNKGYFKRLKSRNHILDQRFTYLNDSTFVIKNN